MELTQVTECLTAIHRFLRFGGELRERKEVHVWSLSTLMPPDLQMLNEDPHSTHLKLIVKIQVKFGCQLDCI